LPLVTLANQTCVNLLIADKIFKNFLTTQDTQRMRAYEEQFISAHQDFSNSLAELTELSVNNPVLNSQLISLHALEERYFSESNKAMSNYKRQL
jgi:methyl-accepting chemotaxis protein